MRKKLKMDYLSMMRSGNTTLSYVAICVALFLLVAFFKMNHSFASSWGEENANEKSSVEINDSEPKEKPPSVIHEVETIIKATSVNNEIKKPLKIDKEKHAVECPNGKEAKQNVACSKVYVEYFFKVQPKKNYYLYVETIAPTIMDNSLWVSPPLDANRKSKFDRNDSNCKNFDGKKSKYLPHKHLASSGSKLLCCPLYLSKNEKKKMNSFYSECCFDKLGKKENEVGCVFDLEVSNEAQWNLYPRAFRIEEESLLGIRIYFREDGTSITAVFLSSDSGLDSIQ